MNNPVHHNKHPVDDLPTLSLLRVLHGAAISHREAIDDARQFNEKIIQAVNELMARADRDGLAAADPSEMRRLRRELAEAREQLEQARLPRTVEGTDAPAVSAVAPTAKPKLAKSARSQRVTEIIDECVKQGMKTKAVVDRLNETGIATTHGNPWTYSAVYKTMQKMRKGAGSP